MHPIVASWLADVITDSVTIVSDDIGVEARANQWSFSVSSDEAAMLATQDVEEFVLTIVRARCDSLERNGSAQGAMTFYCWFDEMECHLCFSMVSAKRDALPFGCDVIDAALPLIAAAFLDSKFHDGIAWGELRSPDSPGITADRPPLPVWSTPIP